MLLSTMKIMKEEMETLKSLAARGTAETIENMSTADFELVKALLSFTSAIMAYEEEKAVMMDQMNKKLDRLLDTKKE